MQTLVLANRMNFLLRILVLFAFSTLPSISTEYSSIEFCTTSSAGFKTCQDVSSSPSLENVASTFVIAAPLQAAVSSSDEDDAATRAKVAEDSLAVKFSIMVPPPAVIPMPLLPKNNANKFNSGRKVARMLLQQQQQQGPSPCVECFPGTYADGVSDVDSCMVCPRGTFAMASGSSSCTLCPNGTTTEDVGTYSNQQCILEALIGSSTDVVDTTEQQGYVFPPCLSTVVSVHLCATREKLLCTY